MHKDVLKKKFCIWHILKYVAICVAHNYGGAITYNNFWCDEVQNKIMHILESKNAFMLAIITYCYSMLQYLRLT